VLGLRISSQSLRLVPSFQHAVIISLYIICRSLRLDLTPTRLLDSVWMALSTISQSLRRRSNARTRQRLVTLYINLVLLKLDLSLVKPSYGEEMSLLVKDESHVMFYGPWKHGPACNVCDSWYGIKVLLLL
jgi:hypothetical protein